MGKKSALQSIKLTFLLAESLAKKFGENEGEPATGETRRFQSNNLSYVDIISPAQPGVCVCSLRRKLFR